MTVSNLLPVWLSQLGVLLACGLLSACAFAPGISIGEGIDRESAGSASSGGGVPLPGWIRAYEPSRESDGAQAVSKRPPVGIVFPITPALISMLRDQQVTEVEQDVKRLFAASKPYTIGPGDVLNIVVWDHPELSLPAAASNSAADAASFTGVGNGYNVSPEGLIQFPFAGRIKLGGLTESQAREELVGKLGKFIKDPQITLRIQAYRSGRVYVDGEVRLPGLLAVNDVPLTLPEAISRAGGFSAMADRSTVAITRGGSTTQINFPQLARLGVNPAGILLAPGDMVQVLSRDEAKVSVLGEVLRPAALPLRNGSMTLSEALSESGGVSQVSGDPRQIYVLRNGASGNAEIYHLNASTPAAYALASGFDLKARDVVFVDPSALVRWNRVISLLLPSAQAGNVARDAFTR